MCLDKDRGCQAVRESAQQHVRQDQQYGDNAKQEQRFITHAGQTTQDPGRLAGLSRRHQCLTSAVLAGEVSVEDVAAVAGCGGGAAVAAVVGCDGAGGLAMLAADVTDGWVVGKSPSGVPSCPRPGLGTGLLAACCLSRSFSSSGRLE